MKGIRMVLELREIFPQMKNFEILEKLKGYSAEKILFLIGNINYYLKSGKNDLEILTEYFSYEKPDVFSSTILRILKSNNASTRFSLFSERVNLEFMTIVLSNYDTINKSTHNKGSIQDFLIVYLKLNETSFGEDQTEFDSLENKYFYEFSHIVFTAKLYDTFRPKNIAYQLLKIKTLFHYYYKNHPSILQEFYSNNNIKNSDIWFGEILTFLTQQKLSTISYIDVKNEVLRNYFDDILINSSLNKNIVKEDIKRNPILKINNDYLILDWNYFFIGFYYKLNFELFKLYRKAVKEISFPDYKSLMSKKIGEEILFRYLIELNSPEAKNHICKLFDSKVDGFPDCYLRIGYKIFIIEFKDYDIEDRLLDSYNFSDLKKSIDERFVRKKRS